MRRRVLTRPQKWVITLALLVLALGLANLVRMGVAVRYAFLLPELPMAVPLEYLAAVGAFWGVVLTACAWGLLRFRRWGRWGTLAAVTLYQAHVWVNHLAFDASDYARQTRLWDLLMTLLLLALVWGLLSLHSVQSVFVGQALHAVVGSDDKLAQAPHVVGGSVTADPGETRT
jgi:hypothetical protein